MDVGHLCAGGLRLAVGRLAGCCAAALLCCPALVPCCTAAVRLCDAGVVAGNTPFTIGARPAPSGQPSALHSGGRRRATKGPLRGPCRLPCGARSRGPVAELASFAALSCAQTGGDKSVHEARCARGPQALCSSAPKRRAASYPPAAGRGVIEITSAPQLLRVVHVSEGLCRAAISFEGSASKVARARAWFTRASCHAA